MKQTSFVLGVALLLTSPSTSLAAAPAQTVPVCQARTLPIDGNAIWTDLGGDGETTVVFEAGFGNDSSVWSTLVPKVQALGVKTLIYDRAGMGKSSLDAKTPFSLDNDTHTLTSLLAACGVKERIIFVGHSYGGAIGLRLASLNPHVRALVLLDAVVPGVWTDDEVTRNLAMMRPQYDALRAQAPALAKVAIPFAEAMPDTARQINALPVSENLPIIDIKAENGQSDPQSAATWLLAHQHFTDGHAHRTYILAKGSRHKVMEDQPDLVLQAIATMVKSNG